MTHRFSIPAMATLIALGSASALAAPSPAPKFSSAVAFDRSIPLRDIKSPVVLRTSGADPSLEEPLDIRPDRGRVPDDSGGFSGDGAVSAATARMMTMTAPAISGPLVSFDGLSNQDNFNLLGGRVNPPDPVGDVGPNHYVEMINLVWAVYDKQGNRLAGPATLGSIWQGFPVADCALNAGDPIVVYDQLEDRWILSQFTSRGPVYYNCVAVSQTGDPTGAYHRYAFVTQPDPDLAGGTFFPDYPKYGVWTDSYVMTTRDFGDIFAYGISVYALEKRKMITGDPKARAVQFFLDSDVVDLHLMGDGLLPADIDGTRRPPAGAAIPIVGTMDDDYLYGAPFDALNVFELKVLWNSKPVASFGLKTQLPVAAFDSNYPCGPSRGCIPQPGITNPDQWVDVLSYRQRPTHRLAYRNFGTHEALVTNQAVEAAPNMAGVRWYEIRRTAGVFSVHQQGTFSPTDGIHRWMGSAAMDWQGNIALGYSVSNATDVFPGIRYTGRLAGDPLGQMTLGEGTIVEGTGVQRTTNSRWGDYSSLNVDPTDDCTFWYVNEYYTAAGQASSVAGWQTRIGSFKLPGCNAR